MQSHQMKRAVAGASAPTDPNFKQVTLLLHGDGTNGGQNNTFIDGSTNNFTITRNGNVAQGTFSPYSQPDGRWSNYFDSNGDYLTLVYTTALQFTADFTIECWVYPVSRVTSFPCIVNNYSSFTTNGGFAIFAGHNSANTLKYNVAFNGTFPAIESTNNIIYNAWSHLALVRSGSTITLYVNGTSEGTATSSATVTGTANNWWIGAAGDSVTTSYFHGYISNLRALKGTAQYTSTFTPPTSPLTAITNTSLLTCQSNWFKDNSSNAFGITKNGNTAVAPFSSFAPTDAYVASTNGGSAEFFANPDYLVATSSTAFDIGTSDFTIEAWIYLKSLMSGYAMIAGTDGVNNYFAVSTTDVIMFNNTSEIRGAATISLNQWNHIVWQVSGGNAQMYCNGTRVYNAAYGSFTTSQTAMSVGRSLFYSNYYTYGCISNLRVVIGSAVYSGTTITVPTAPLTAVTNTKLLLNCINGAVVDNAAKNDIETVGNAQVSTTQAKFGTGSLYFDGTGDYLVTNTSPFIPMHSINSGQFTVEFWMYRAGNGAGGSTDYDAIIGSNSGASSVWGVYIQRSTNKIGFFVGGTLYLTSSTVSNSSWTHVAVTRDSANELEIFINGTSGYSATITGTSTLVNPLYIGWDGVTSNYLYYGYIDDLRITQGVARYTANFTPPTRAFPDK